VVFDLHLLCSTVVAPQGVDSRSPADSDRELSSRMRLDLGL